MPETAPETRRPAALPAPRERIDGAEVLEWTRRYLAQFVVWPSDASLTMVALWVAHAHARDKEQMLIWQYTPRLAFLSATPGGGKSWAQRIVAKLSPNGKIMLEPSEAAVARTIGSQHRPVFLDEADILFGSGKRKAAIRTIINSGYERDGEWSRASGSGTETADLPVFGALGFAGLDVLREGTGDSLNALLDRCLFVHMRKAPEGHRPPRFDDRARAVAEVISARLGRWTAQETADGLAAREPYVPDGLGNRPFALWEPLFAIAEAAGGDWPALAEESCTELESSAHQPQETEDDAAMVADWFARQDVS